ncbi:MAG: TonB family protein [candidate division WOR-3 bacterium]|nr:TonB family protein [candidate division WOR-3 bacterium]
MRERQVVLPEWQEDKGSKKRFIIFLLFAILIHAGILWTLRSQIARAIEEARLREIQLLEEKAMKSKFINPKLQRKVEQMKKEVQKKEEPKKQQETAKKDDKPGDQKKIDLSPKLQTQSTELPKPTPGLGGGPKLDINVNIDPRLLSSPSIQTEQLDVKVDLNKMNIEGIANLQAEIDISSANLADVGVADVVVGVTGRGASISDILSQEAVPAISLGGGIEGGASGGLGLGTDVGGGIGGGGKAVSLAQNPSLASEVKIEVSKPTVTAPAVQEVASVSSPAGMQLEGEVANRQILNRVKPVYPKRAKQQGWEGTVVLSFSVDANGSVFNIQVIRSSGYPDLDNSAIQALSQWKFAPKPGKAEEKGRLTVRFVLT